MSNEDLYARLASRCGIDSTQFEHTAAVGRADQPVSLLKRRVRWFQQTLKTMGVLERTDQRGVWQLSGNHKQFKENNGAVSLVAFSTTLGVAIWGCSRPTLDNLDDEITLVITSPPYPLRAPRAYQNPNDQEYTDFIWGASHFLSFYSVKHIRETFLISPPKRLGICVNWSDWLTCASTGYEFLLS